MSRPTLVAEMFPPPFKDILVGPPRVQEANAIRSKRRGARLITRGLRIVYPECKVHAEEINLLVVAEDGYVSPDTARNASH